MEKPDYKKLLEQERADHKATKELLEFAYAAGAVLSQENSDLKRENCNSHPADGM